MTSKAWNNEITPKVTAKGYKPMFYFTVDPRTVAVRKGFGRMVKTPDDMRGVKMRVPSSKLLQQFYRLAGANPTVVAWGETPSALKQGVADALDPSVGALYTFGFIDIVEIDHDRRIGPDAQMFAANCRGSGAAEGPAAEIRGRQREDAGRKLRADPRPRGRRRWTRSRKAGVKFYTPTRRRAQKWVEACGEQRPNGTTSRRSSPARSTRSRS